jgi:3-hydroxybutyryl-CoA dehydratase
MTEKAKSLKIGDIREGQEASFIVTVTEKDIDSFAENSGDRNPLHMDKMFAEARGFMGRVAHGGLLISYMSRLAGMYLPGENCLLQSVNCKFIEPVYAGNDVNIKGMVVHVSTGVKVIELKVVVDNLQTGKTAVKGSMQIGFTEEKD